MKNLLIFGLLVLILQSKMLQFKWVSNLNLLMEEKYQVFEGLSMNVIFVGKSIEFMMKK